MRFLSKTLLLFIFALFGTSYGEDLKNETFYIAPLQTEHEHSAQLRKARYDVTFTLFVWNGATAYSIHDPDSFLGGVITAKTNGCETQTITFENVPVFAIPQSIGTFSRCHSKADIPTLLSITNIEIKPSDKLKSGNLERQVFSDQTITVTTVSSDDVGVRVQLKPPPGIFY